MSAEAFLRACMRDVAWNFFYGWVNFDHVIGTRNLYGQVDMYAGSFNGVMKEAGVDYTERFDAAHIMATFKAILRDWVNEGFDPFAAPVETGTAFGTKRGDNVGAIERTRIATRRMPGLPGDSPLRNDMPITEPSPTSRKANPRFWPSQASKASCMLSACSNISAAPT